MDKFHHQLYLTLERIICALCGHPTFERVGSQDDDDCSCGKIYVYQGERMKRW